MLTCNIGNKEQQQSRAKTSSDKLRPTETKRNNTDNKEEQQSRANNKQGQTETNRDKEGPRETTHTTKKDNGDMCMSQTTVSRHLCMCAWCLSLCFSLFVVCSALLWSFFVVCVVCLVTLGIRLSPSVSFRLSLSFVILG